MYSLEQVDDENKRRQAAMGNISASNDPQQQVHDSNEQLIKGAEVLGAGRTLGLTDDEAISTKQATMRREQRKRRAERAERAGNEAAARAFLAQDDAKYSFVGSPQQEADYPDPFGESQDDDQSYTREEKVRNDVLPEEFLTDNEIREQREGRSRPTVQMQNSTVQGERARRLAAKDKEEGRKAAAEERRRFRGDLSPSEIDQEVTRRINAREPSPGTKNPSMPVNLRRDIAEELLSRRERGVNGGVEMRQMLNDAKAAKEAEYIRSRGYGLPRQLADEDIGRIDEIRSLGNASSVGHGDNRPGSIQVVRTDSPANYGQAVQMVGPEGQIVGYADQQVSHFLGDVNADSSDNVLNAPLSAGQKFVVDNLPDYGREGGTSFGDRGVSIMAELQQFGDRMRGLQGYGYEDFSKNPRSVEEIEKAIANIIGRGGELGDTFYRFDDEAGKPVASSEPGFDEVLYKMRYSADEKQRLAYALQQLQMANLSPVNQEQKRVFAERRPVSSIKDNIVFDAPEFRQDDTPLAKIKNEKVGRGKKAKSVRGELAQLSDPNAAKPFYGAVEGEPVPRARFIRGADRGKSEAELIEKYGAQGLVGAEVERRYEEDRSAREASLTKPDGFAQEQRALDSQFAQAGRRAEAQAEKAEKFELARLMFEGASKEGKFDLGTTIDGRPRVIEAAPAGRKLVVPSSSSMNQNSNFNIDNLERVGKGVFRRREQPITPAAVPTSIAPQPGTGTGNQPTPAVDAGRGGWMGGGGKGRIVNPYDDTPAPRPERKPPTGMGSPFLSALANKRMRRRANIERGGVAALGAGGSAAILAGILGTGNREEEEQY